MRRGCWRPVCPIRDVTSTIIRRGLASSHAGLAQQKRVRVADLLDLKNSTATAETTEVHVAGWVRSLRKQKRIAFATLSDGSSHTTLQAVLTPSLAAELTPGTAVKLHGTWQASAGREQSHELSVSSVEVLGANDAERNPVQPKYQTPEFLRTIPHLRVRTSANVLLLRLRSQVIASLTRFFDEEGFVQTHTPVITSSDCEGAGEVFTVSSGAVQESPLGVTPGQEVHAEHFFRTPKYLTVSAQLHLEALAMAVDKVWTLSPTFRAERSDTARHLSEFYMLEAEMCFVDSVSDVMDLIENMLRTTVSTLRESTLGSDILSARTAAIASVPRDAKDEHDIPTADALAMRWAGMAATHWPRIMYADAIMLLQRAVTEGTANFSFEATYENGLQAEHERYIASTVGEGKPVFVTHYPFAQKAFYMPRTGSTGSVTGPDTADCFDLLVPSLCELAGGSMRAHNLTELEANMKVKGVSEEGLEWYKDLRRHGSVPHGGFGLGFDRLLCYLSGTGNVRDVVAFPRWVGRCAC